MKKTNIIILILSILLLPFQGSAKDECDSNKIEIKSIELVDKTTAVEELSQPKVNKLNINTDISLSKIGDQAKYKIILENKSKSDYELKDKDLKSDSEFINYSITYEDNDNIIKGNSEKIVYLRISYAKEVPQDKLQDGKFQDNQTINIAGVTKENRQSILVNPATGTIFSLILIIVICLSYLIVSKKQKKKILLLLIALLSIPTVVKAVCSFSIDVNSKVTIDTRTATFKTGEEVNIQMKKLANPEVDPTSITTSYQENNILYFKKSDNLPNGLTEENIVSTNDSECPIYIWFDTDTIYYYTEAKLIYLNENASSMFFNLRKVLTVEGLNRVDVSKTTYLNSFFTWCIELLSIDPLEKWETSNVIDMYHMFINCRNIENLDSLINWNISNVERLDGIFERCWKLKNVNGLKNWDISKVTSLKMVFYENKELSDISALSNWNVSNVTVFQQLFMNCFKLEDISPLSNWDTSSVTNMTWLFYKCELLKDLSPISNWNTSSVTDIGRFISDCTSLKTLDAISNWDVSNVTSMMRAFYNLNNLEDASGINNWDISNVTEFAYIFTIQETPFTLPLLNPVHPEFTKRPGTWNNGGTFIPNN